jgi:hypothetical protein
MLNKSIVAFEINNHIRTLIVKQILVFVAIKTRVIIMSLNESNVLCMHL